MIDRTTSLTNGMFRIISGERFTPYSLAEKLRAIVLLESASFMRGRERWSILLLKPAFIVYQRENEIFLERERKRFRVKNRVKDILSILQYFARQHAGSVHDFPLPAGGVGYLSYEFCTHFDTIKIPHKEDEFGIPDALFIFGHIFLIFDHYTDNIILLGLNYREHEIDLKSALDEVEARINDLDFNFMARTGKEYKARIIDMPEDKKNYMEGVKKVREQIIKGNLLQGVLARRVYIETNIPALEAYRNLRSFNPSPYMFLINCGSFQLLGSSPEVHVKVQGRRAILRPIAGTRKRGQSQQEEESLEKDLLSDEKEKAEHLMLVDLARNDLGRICLPGSVEVTESMVIEKYSHVMHIVSQVEGNLKLEKSGADAIRATFPAGTVSGAPKIKAIEVIDALEGPKRGFYAGVVGYLEADGNLDTCITIRSALRHKDKLILQAGAGIVYDSDPEREYIETQNKLGALVKAVGLEV